MPASSIKPISAIVRPVAGGVAGLAAAILSLFSIRKQRKRKLPSKAGTCSDSKGEGTREYVCYTELLRDGGAALELGGCPVPIPSPFAENSGTDLSAKSNATGKRAGPTTGTPTNGFSGDRSSAETAAAATAASASQPSYTGPQTSDTGQPGTGRPSTRDDRILKHIAPCTFDLSRLKLKLVDGKPVKLGEGGFGAVYAGFLEVREVAVKIATGTSAAQRDNFCREIEFLQGCRDPSIVRYLGACLGEPNVLIMELMPGGNLLKAIAKDHEGRFLWRHRGAKLAINIAQGLHHLHSRSVVHLDLKSSNILLTEDQKQARISDTGLAKFTTEAGTRPGQGLSFPWASPEQILGKKCTLASDMFSFGVILWEICTGGAPSSKRDYRPVRTPEECPQAMADLIAQCLLPEATQRPTAMEAFRVIQQSMLSPSRNVPTAHVEYGGFEVLGKV